MKDDIYLDIKIILFGFIVFSLIFLLGLLDTFESARGSITIWFEDIYRTVGQNVENVSELGGVFNNIDAVKAENEKLRKDIISLEEDLGQAYKELDDVAYIFEQGLTDFDPEYQIIAVRVFTYDPTRTGFILINKGKLEGVGEEDVAVLGNYVLGELVKVHENYSIVKLIGSPDYNINVISLKSNTRGILTGNFTGELEVKEIFNDTPLSEKDVFVTEGNDGIYPYGLYVGTVERVLGTPAEPTKTAVLSNKINFKNLDRLYVMKVK